MKWLKELYNRTIKIATMYTGTFIVIMALNQLLFFGFCLNPVCLIAAMPHVLFLTAIIGSWINKENNWGKQDNTEDKDITDINIRTSAKKEGDLRREISLEALKEKNEIKLINDVKLCPKCNSKMDIRTARNGIYKGKQFWGCSQYPRCKSIINI